MNNTNKVNCPYCGREMRFINQFPLAGFLFVCHCGATSPVGEEMEEAYALARHRPLQKPLTLGKVKEQVAVWIEYFGKCKSTERVEPALYVNSSRGTTLFDEGYCEQYRLENDEYGEKWRCWARKPTDEEMEAEGWKDHETP